MKPLKVICLALCSLAAATSWSQETDFDPSLEIRFAPFSLVDPNTPAIQLGMQLNGFKRFAFAADLGYAYNTSKIPGRVNRQYYKLRSEVKLFLRGEIPSPDNAIAKYISLEGFYIPEKYRKENGWYSSNDGNNYTYEHNDIRKTVRGFCFKFGVERLFGNHFLVDGYIGAGYRNIKITNNRHVETITDPFIRQEWVRTSDLPNGNYPKPHGAAGLKIGYLIW